jgi:hypothetical protein
MSNGNWVSFNSTPPGLLSGSAVNGYSTSAISDASGTLLFYSDDIGVMNALHQPMANGPTPIPPYWPNNLPTNPFQGRLIIPKPGEQGRYIVMFNGDVENTPQKYLAYGEVDMTMNGGLGAWVDSNLTYLTDSVRRAVNGTLHANATDYWVLTHGRYNNLFLAYQVNTTGVVPTAVVSQVGSPDTVVFNGSSQLLELGQLTFSLSGDQVAHSMSNGASWLTARMELFNFNRSTGQLTPYASIDSLQNVMGSAFSPDGTKLYVHEAGGVPVPCNPCSMWRIWQYDISDPSPSAIQSSKFLLKEVAPTNGGPGLHSMLMGPDGKIYIQQSDIPPHDDKLGVVNFPDLTGSACGYDEFGLQCTAGGPGYFLPPNQLLMYHDSQPVWLGVQDAGALPTLNVYPNPITGSFRIVPQTGTRITGLRWLDALGRIVRNDVVPLGQGIIEAERGDLAAGSYLVQAVSGNITSGQVRVIVH